MIRIGALLLSLLAVAPPAGAVSCQDPNGIKVRFGDLSAFDVMYLARQEPVPAYPNWVDPDSGRPVDAERLYGRFAVISPDPIGHRTRKDPRNVNEEYQEWTFLAVLNNCRRVHLVMSQIDPEIREWYEFGGARAKQPLPLDMVLHTFNVQPVELHGVEPGAALVVKPRFDRESYFGMLGPTWDHDSVDLQPHTVIHVKEVRHRPVRDPNRRRPAPEGVMALLAEVVTGPHQGTEVLVPWRPDYLAKLDQWYSPSHPDYSGPIRQGELREGMASTDIVLAWGLPRYRVSLTEYNRLGLKAAVEQGLGKVWPQATTPTGAREAWFYPGRLPGDPAHAYLVLEADGTIFRALQPHRDMVKPRFHPD